MSQNYALRTAVVGVGYLGRFHAQKQKILGTLIGVCDASTQRAQEISRELGTAAFSNPQELIGQVDAVTIASDTKSHFELSRLFLEAGIHVLVEKPICETSAEAKVLCDLAEKSRLVFQVGHIERFNPALTKGLLQIKKPRHLEFSRLAPFKPRSLSVDVILDLMIHDLDLAYLMAQSDMESFSASGSSVISDFNDYATCFLRFKNGVTANITVSRVDRQSLRQIIAVEEQRVLHIDLGQSFVHIAHRSEHGVDNPLQLESLQADKADALMLETESFLSAVQGHNAVLVTGRDGLRALELAEQIIKNVNQRL